MCCVGIGHTHCAAGRRVVDGETSDKGYRGQTHWFDELVWLSGQKLYNTRYLDHIADPSCRSVLLIHPSVSSQKDLHWHLSLVEPCCKAISKNLAIHVEFKLELSRVRLSSRNTKLYQLRPGQYVDWWIWIDFQMHYRGMMCLQ